MSALGVLASLVLALGQGVLPTLLFVCVVLFVPATAASIALIRVLRRPARQGVWPVLSRALISLILGLALSLAAYVAFWIVWLLCHR